MLATSNASSNRPRWQTLVLIAVGFWMSASLCVDLVVMPSLYTAGMMTQADFASAGYEMFWLFNRVEIVCAALALTGLFALRRGRDAFSTIVSGGRSRWAVALAGLLLAIALCYTYVLSPEMSALGLQLNADVGTTVEVPAEMNIMHGVYWGLEALKLLASGALLSLCYQDMRNQDMRSEGQGVHR